MVKRLLSLLWILISANIVMFVTFFFIWLFGVMVRFFFPQDPPAWTHSLEEIHVAASITTGLVALIVDLIIFVRDEIL